MVGRARERQRMVARKECNSGCYIPPAVRLDTLAVDVRTGVAGEEEGDARDLRRLSEAAQGYRGETRCLSLSHGLRVPELPPHLGERHPGRHGIRPDAGRACAQGGVSSARVVYIWRGGGHWHGRRRERPLHGGVGDGPSSTAMTRVAWLSAALEAVSHLILEPEERLHRADVDHHALPASHHRGRLRHSKAARRAGSSGLSPAAAVAWLGVGGCASAHQARGKLHHRP